MSVSVAVGVGFLGEIGNLGLGEFLCVSCISNFNLLFIIVLGVAVTYQCLLTFLRMFIYSLTPLLQKIHWLPISDQSNTKLLA